jgi:glyoxylase-like metal-dependent hydrolase (beta-lactamase superfamily II)/rhodanese-related sulfurtransferase
MIFEQIATGGCQSYLVGCAETRAAVLIDPEASQVDRYLGLLAREGLRLHYAIDTHTHADHFSGAKALAAACGAPVAAHRLSPAPYVDMRIEDGDSLLVGGLKFRARHTPGHTRDSMSLILDDRAFTGDALLIEGTGRTDLPTGDPEALFDSLFNGLLTLNPETMVFPAHEYKGRSSSTIGHELVANPRLQNRDKAAFVEMMTHLNLSAPIHLTEALRTNMSGGKTVSQLLAEARAATPFIAMDELAARVASGDLGLALLDVREKDAFIAGHIPGARHLPRGQLELRVDQELSDPTERILTCCEFGHISTLAAFTLRTLGYRRAAALDGGMKAWREMNGPLETGPAP